MGKLRSVNTSFWSDPFIEDLSAQEKLLYLYLITNEKTNMLGVYEVSLKKISFETGVEIEMVSKAFERFQRLGKIYYEQNYIVLLRFLKHQNYNTNMMKSAIDVFNDLPEFIRGKNVTLSKTDVNESFRTLSNHLVMVRKIEVEVEVETEIEVEVEKESKGKENSIEFPPDSFASEKKEIKNNKPPKPPKPPLEVLLPFDTENFKQHWQQWKDYKKSEHRFSFKSEISEGISLKELFKNSGENEEVAIKMITTAISNGWKGLFKLKNENNGSNAASKQPVKTWEQQRNEYFGWTDNSGNIRVDNKVSNGDFEDVSDANVIGEDFN